METIFDLITALDVMENFYSDDMLIKKGDLLYYPTYDLDDDDPVEIALVLANNLLITSNGYCNYKNMRILEQKGFEIYPGEKDSFGWLIGCIQKNDRVLVFG